MEIDKYVKKHGEKYDKIHVNTGTSCIFMYFLDFLEFYINPNISDIFQYFPISAAWGLVLRSFPEYFHMFVNTSLLTFAIQSIFAKPVESDPA